MIAVNEEMADHEVVLKLAATRDDGEWRRWCDAHPPRKPDEPGRDRDLEVAGFVANDGREIVYCNADDLIDDLGRYVTECDDEALSDDDWDHAIAVSYADKKSLASRVVFALYEQGADVPDFRRILSATLGDGRLRELALELGISEKRLLGWEPTETHDHLDGDGNPCRAADAVTTRVTRDPEWDDRERAKMLGLLRYREGVHRCGIHRDVVNDPNVHLTVYHEVCEHCRQVDLFNRMQEETDRDEMHKRWGKNPPASAPHPADGRDLYVREKTLQERPAQKP